MKSALLSTYDSGGAGIAALRLHQGLQNIGVDSHFFSKWGTKPVKNHTVIDSPEVRNDVFEDYVKRKFADNIYPGNSLCSAMYPSIGFDFLAKIETCDIVNLHWVASFVSIEAIKKIRDMGKPLVWTLHDQNPMTGACHYANGCTGYLNDCADCPQLKENSYDMPKLILNIKEAYIPQELVVVSPSQWLADCARKSRVFRKNRIEVIPNALDTRQYQPQDRSAAKTALGLPAAAKVILFGANDISEERKGVRKLIEAIRLLEKQPAIQELVQKDQLYILMFGHAADLLEMVKIPCKLLGYTDDEDLLVQAYSAADVVALPSLEDNLPNIMLEGLACGTPIVSFALGGMLDTIVDGQNGYLVPYGNVNAFSQRLLDVLQNDDLRPLCRDYAVKNFALAVQAESYKKLYEELLQKKPAVVKENIPAVFPEIGKYILPDVCRSLVAFQRQYDEVKTEGQRLFHDRNRLQCEKDDAEQQKTVFEQEVLALRGTVAKLEAMCRQQQERGQQEIIQLRGIVTGLEQELHHIYGSRSWRFVQQLRKCKKMLKGNKG